MSHTVTDQLSRSVTIEDLSRGIVSLVPSQTELLFELGLSDLVTGVTKFCIHPQQAHVGRVIVGGTKNPDHDKIRALNPGLILANKEENNQSDIEQLSKDFPVWISDVHDLESALAMIASVGSITGTIDAATALTNNIRSEFSSMQVHQASTALYLIWKDPMLVAGKDTFISDMMSRCGLINIVNQNRYPEWNATTRSPDLVLLSSEPYPFSEKHIAEISERFPKSHVMLVDGTYFSWYGSRLSKAPGYFTSLLKQLQNQTGTLPGTVS